MGPSDAPVTCLSLLEGALTLSLREEPFAPRVMLAVGLEVAGLACRLARVYGPAGSRAAVDEAVRAERLAGGMVLVVCWGLRRFCCVEVVKFADSILA